MARVKRRADAMVRKLAPTDTAGSKFVVEWRDPQLLTRRRATIEMDYSWTNPYRDALLATSGFKAEHIVTQRPFTNLADKFVLEWEEEEKE